MQEILVTLFGIDEIITSERTGYLYHRIDERLRDNQFLPQALFSRCSIEVLATTDSTSDSLENHTGLARLDPGGRIIPIFRPEDVSNPDPSQWHDSIKTLIASSRQDRDTF